LALTPDSFAQNLEDMSKVKNKTELFQKKEMLRQVADTLKSEFVGIDNIIDEVMSTVSSWYLFPQIHERPVVVNLWGLTGVGKTALVKRLSELLGYKDRFFAFDLNGSERGQAGIEGQLQELRESSRNYPVIIALDEFQHARTIDEGGGEIRKDYRDSNPIWQLLDSGVFEVRSFRFRHHDFQGFCRDIEYMVNSGVKVKNGVVVEKLELYHEIMTDDEGEEKGSDDTCVSFVPKRKDYQLFEYVEDDFTHPKEMRNHLNTLNERETLAFLLSAEMKSGAPKQVDCSNALLFILGNLDEAYQMAGDFNPDIDADSFHELTLKITLPDIKEALKQRFRSEQIARLGNNHIIYPAFNKKTYEQLIELELNKLSAKILNKEGIKIAFENTLQRLIYREGVYPTQGTRPIYTTIHRLVHTVLGKVLAEYYLQVPKAEIINLASDMKNLRVFYLVKAQGGDGLDILHEIQIPHALNLENLRAQKCDDKQALVAVHETGHAVTCLALTGVVPKCIYSHSAGENTAGFVQSGLDYNNLARREIIDRVAVFLGGIAAEELVFGAQNRTTGASTDLKNATEFITDMLKKEGMGDALGTFQNPSPRTNYKFYDDNGTINQAGKKLMQAGFQKALVTLEQHRTLLLQLADYLSNNASIQSEGIEQLTRKYAPEIEMKNRAEIQSTRYPYRSRLKQLLSEPQHDEYNPSGFETGVLLNKIKS